MSTNPLMGMNRVTMNTPSRFARATLLATAAACLPALLALTSPAQAASAADEARARETWRTSISHTPTPGEGCFRASYPAMSWHRVVCKAAPARPFGIASLPRHGAAGRTVGNGNDFAAVTSTITKSAVGSFPSVTGVTKETGADGANSYTLQLNSGFMNTAGCNGSTTGACQTWEQFVYSSGEETAFMQYWLINYGNSCPAGGSWNSYEGSCYKNSAAVSVPKIAITSLGKLKVSATAVSGGTDTLVFTGPTEAYTTTGKDSVVDLATAWKQSEFNIVGDGGGSKAKFNTGVDLTVEIALQDGGTAAPTCQGKDGTTGETNNLTLGKCTASGGATPSVQFTEKN